MDGASPANRPNPNPNINNNNAIFYVSLGVCLLLYLSTFLISSNDVADQQAATIINDAQEAHSASQEAPIVSAVPRRRIIIMPPATPASYQLSHILPEVVDDYMISQEGCTPEDVTNEEKHKIPPPRDASSTKKNEPKSVMVIYVAVALLLMSLGATLVDFCKAKSELKNDNANQNSRKKPALTRRCSLADLTVLRHTRKELLRKESFCGIGSTAADRDAHSGSKHWKINRPPLRLD